jgi:hypothetical protein
MLVLRRVFGWITMETTQEQQSEELVDGRNLRRVQSLR